MEPVRLLDATTTLLHFPAPAQDETMAVIERHRSMSRTEQWMRRSTCLKPKVYSRLLRARVTHWMRRTSLSKTEGSQPPVEGSTGSSDETKALPGTEDAQQPCAGSGDSMPGDPTKIGRYRIIRRLGQGGFGRVYLAHDDDLDRPVAIKVPNPERITAPEDVEAYLNEARILARLDHPYIVPVFDVGRTEDGLCFVVSKLVEGSDLAVKIDRARGYPSGTRQNWSPRLPMLCITPTPEGWSIGTSSQQTSSSTSQVNRVLPISVLPSKTRTSARVRGTPGRPPT